MLSKPLPAEVATELLKASAEATLITDARGIMIFANREAELLFGYDAEEMLGQPVEMLVPGEFRSRHEAHRSHYAAAPRSRPMVAGLELYGQRKDDARFRAEISLTPVQTEEGLLVACQVREINPRDESEAYFRVFLESAPDAMIIVDEDGKIAIVNGQAERMFGYNRNEMLGRPIESLLPDRLRKKHVGHRSNFAAQPALRPMGA